MHLARNRNSGAWFIAWALALALNTGAVVGLRSLAAPRYPETTPRPEPVRLVFKSSGPDNRKSEEPRSFSELPPDRKDLAPKQPDFLSNVTSRARDPIPGGDAALPRMQGESDVPMVKLEPDGTPPSPPPEPAPQATEPASPSSGRASSAPARPDAAQPGRDEARASPGSAMGSDMAQPEMANPEGNAALTGDVSLNTTAWDYAPWLQRFGRKLMGRWFAPPAYTLGILKDGGWAVVELEISRTGKVLRQELLEEQGHPSLSLAAQSALRSMAPVEPLPADFPEPTLILRLRMIYPRIRPR